MIDRPAESALELGAALRDARKERGWTQATLAAAAGVSRQLLVDVERGRRPGAELSSVLALSRALGLGLGLVPLGPEPSGSVAAVLDELLGEPGSLCPAAQSVEE